MMTFRYLTAVFALAVGIAGSPAAVAQQAGVLRVSAIPDEAPTELQRKFKPLGDYLKQETGLDVQFIPVTDYAAVVEGLARSGVSDARRRAALSGRRGQRLRWLSILAGTRPSMRMRRANRPLVQR